MSVYAGAVYAAAGVLAAGWAVYAYDVWRCRRRQPPPAPVMPAPAAFDLVESPAHDTIQGGLRDDEEDAFIDVIIAYFEAAS